MTTAAGADVAGVPDLRQERILTSEALAFVADLERRFGPRRLELLLARAERQRRLEAGELPDFLPETRDLRATDWTIAPVPADLLDRNGVDRPVGRAQVARPTGRST